VRNYLFISDRKRIAVVRNCRGMTLDVALFEGGTGMPVQRSLTKEATVKRQSVFFQPEFIELMRAVLGAARNASRSESVRPR